RRSPPGRRGQIAGPYGIELGDAPTSPEPNGAGRYVAGDADQGEAPTPSLQSRFWRAVRRYRRRNSGPSQRPG
ncbi:hypothetical protein ACJ9GL_005649, partial [Klebsiella pneumoniae]